MKYSDNLKGSSSTKISSTLAAGKSAVKDNSKQILLTLFSAGLAGCGVAPTSTEGVAVKGLLQNAEVFIDTNEDGVWTEGTDSAKVRTDSNGAYKIETELTGDIVVVTDETTVDKSSGEVIAGITMSAPTGSTAVTVATTLTNELMDSDTLTTVLTQAEAEAKVKSLLGLDESIDVANYNPYAADSLGTDNALAFEKTSQQVMTVINTLAEAESSSTLGTDVDKSGAIDNAINAFVAVIEEKIEAPGAPAEPVALVLTSTALVTEVVDKIVEAAVEAGDSSAFADATFTDSLAAITTAIAQVNTVIDEVTDLTTTADPVFAAAQSALVDMTQSVAIENDDSLATIDETTTTVEALTSIPEIAGDTSGDVTDTSATVVDGADALTATGTATVEAGTYTFVGSATGDHGSFVINADGSWVYTISDSALNALPAGTISESFAVTATNASDSSQSVSKLITIDLVGINDAPYVYTEIANEQATADTVYTMNVDPATFVDVDNTTAELTYSATSADGSALPSWLTFGVSDSFRMADSAITWNDYDPDTSSDVTYTNTVSVADNTMTINGSPELNLTNLINAANNSGDYKMPTLNIDLLEVPSGSGSGSVTFKLVDGSDSARSAGERYIELEVEVDWATGNDGSVSITLPTQEAAGHYITDSQGTTSFTISNLDSDTITVSESGDLSASSATINVKLAALIDKLEDVGSISLLQEGDFNLTIETDLPLTDMNGTSITALTTNLAIAEEPADPTGSASSASSSHPDITDLTFYGNPTSADVGTYEIDVIATDLAGASVTDTFTLEII